MMLALLSMAIAPSFRRLEFDEPVASLAFDDRGALYVGTLGVLVGCDPTNGTKRALWRSPRGSESSVGPIAVSKSGEVLFAARDGLYRWSPKEGARTLRPSPPFDGSTSVASIRAISPSGRTIALLKLAELTAVREDELGNGRKIVDNPALGGVFGLALNDARCAFNLGTSLLAYDLATGKTRRLGATEDAPFSLRWIDGSERLLSIGPFAAEMRDARSGRTIGRRTLTSYDHPVQDACRPSDRAGTWILTDDGAAFLGDDMSLSRATPMKFSPSVGSAAASADGRLLAVATGRVVRIVSVDPRPRGAEHRIATRVEPRRR